MSIASNRTRSRRSGPLPQYFIEGDPAQFVDELDLGTLSVRNGDKAELGCI